MKSQAVMIAVTFVFALIIIIDGFFSIGFISKASTEIQNWGTIIASFSLGLAAVNLIRVHIRRVMLHRGEWYNSIALLLVMIAQSIIGFVDTSAGKIYNFGFNNIMTPLGSTMFALLAFWIASAAYRAFTARSIDSAILLVAATIVMLGNAPIGETLWSGFAVIKSWIMDVPNMAAQRGIMIGGGIGAIALGIRILMGIERGHLGGGEE
ncbi:hypothetical protein IMX26_15270 [Clostridium sp. 'deep sea']|uniref:hypothetical protein n=1 Tax=Clostridium sp. 'deep sea' TaxID=2779445 RepID=UPI00189693EA|nr:hypothetical protein [Clostridium sp. 'deep sea']QOR34801.1 hypothetical protein IMX26_15270 [Clostridium sp. 'deep sea']